VPTAAQEVVGNGAAHDLPSKTPCDGGGGYARGREERNGTEERNEEEKGDK
jgi:hypothetical protein